ncbi:MAG: hypothetical protein H0U28_06910 [Nocardioidaceae bacterium]|nr:hypothetical protein [Nocardioidaceae bacterium]
MPKPPIRRHLVEISPERAGEESRVAKVAARSFDDVLLAKLVDGLRRSPAWRDGLSFVAESADEIVGQVCSPGRCWTPRENWSMYWS